MDDEVIEAKLALFQPCTCGHECLPVAWHLGGCPYALVRSLAYKQIEAMKEASDGN